MDTEDPQNWDPISTAQAADRFGSVDVDWWVAGGRAIDLFLGWQSRAHTDLDIEIFRPDVDLLFEVLPGWELQMVAAEGTSALTRSSPIPDTVYAVRARPAGEPAWALEVLLADGDTTTWRFRSNNDVSMPLSQLTRTNATGIPFSTPEVQLLYKSMHSRQKDDVDMARCLHRMSRSQRTWLADALRSTKPGHPWIDFLQSANRNQTNEP